MRRGFAFALFLLTAASLAGCGWVRVEAPPARASRQPARTNSPVVARAVEGTVIVQRGDTLYSIARRNEVPLRGLIQANGLTPPYLLEPGDRLALPPPQRTHVVRAGDTVYGISRRYGTDVTSLVRANDIPPPYTIVLGQRLVVPEGNLDTLVAEAPPTSGMAPTTPAAATSPGERTIEVVPLPPPAETAAEPDTSPVKLEKPEPPAEPLKGPVRFIRPVNGRVLSSFGAKSGGLHNDGVNISAPHGTPVRAAEDGIVAYAGSELPGFGKLILLKHADGWTTAYGHNEAVLVERGDRVARGQTIARVGSTGNVSKPQLHFEIRRGAQAVDPMAYLGDAGTKVSALPTQH